MTEPIQQLKPGQPLVTSRPFYPASCAKCGADLKLGPSMAMQMGISVHGHVTCPHCKTFLRTTLLECSMATSVFVIGDGNGGE